MFIKVDNGIIVGYSKVNGVKINKDFMSFYKIGESYLECEKKVKLMQLKNKINQKYKAYIEKYPEVEVSSFKDKATEAAKVIKDPDTPLEDTPYLSALTDYDKDKRNALAKIIDKKIKEVATLEKYASEKRDEIKACNTLEELERVVI